MAIAICKVEAGSPAWKLGIPQGSSLLSINGNAVRDMLDYGFYCAEETLNLQVRLAGGEIKTYCVQKEETEELGIISSSFLMDSERRCKNRCVFCFIDQLPRGMRETLYLKDDDERLSFLFGNYITLTNLSAGDVERIIEMRVTPVNISVHTTDPALRCRMMGNRFAGEALRHMERLAEAGIEMNCQIVLCRDMNDGERLLRTLEDLWLLYPCVQSVAVVPVGLTRYRRGLYPLKAYDRKSACGVLDAVDTFSRRCRKQHGTGWVYAADEWYVQAGRTLPGIEHYDSLGQLENGVGMMAVTQAEFDDEWSKSGVLSSAVRRTLVTGEMAEPFLCALVKKAKEKAPLLEADVRAVKNHFFGGNVAVSGLVTASDIMAQIAAESVKGKLLIPSNMLRSQGDLFLDGTSVPELAKVLSCEVCVVQDGRDLAQELLRSEKK